MLRHVCILLYKKNTGQSNNNLYVWYTASNSTSWSSEANGYLINVPFIGKFIFIWSLLFVTQNGILKEIIYTN
jgi:phosphorylcholine metabolism protein LicD